MKYIFFFFFLNNYVFAINYDELATEDYTLKVGLDKDSKVDGNKNKKDINPKINDLPNNQIVNKNVDLKEAYILKQIKDKYPKNENVKESTNLLTIPEQLKNDLKQNAASNKTVTASNTESKSIPKLLLLRCETDQDYKVNATINMNLYCKDIANKSDILYKLRANAKVDKNNTVSLIAKPYMLEDDLGKTYSIVEDKSKLYNTISGDENIATYVDRRTVESITKAMANSTATDGPRLAQDYLDKKNAAQSTVVQTDTSTVTATNSPKPEASDYGISFLFSAIGSGLKAGVDQLYMDLGYIYYIPKGSIIEAELFVTSF